MSQTDLADKTGIGLVQINRYARDRARIAWDNFEKILDVFPPEHQAILIRAFLLDSVSDRYHGLIDITTTVAGEIHEPRPLPDEFNELPEELQAAFQFIASRSHDAAVADLIVDLARILCGESEIRQPPKPARKVAR